MGGIYGCGCKEVYRFPHITYPYSSCMYFFVAASYSLFIVLMFFVLYIFSLMYASCIFSVT